MSTGVNNASLKGVNGSIHLSGSSSSLPGARALQSVILSGLLTRTVRLGGCYIIYLCHRCHYHSNREKGSGNFSVPETLVATASTPKPREHSRSSGKVQSPLSLLPPFPTSLCLKREVRATSQFPWGSVQRVQETVGEAGTFIAFVFMREDRYPPKPI